MPDEDELNTDQPAATEPVAVAEAPADGGESPAQSAVDEPSDGGRGDAKQVHAKSAPSTDPAANRRKLIQKLTGVDDSDGEPPVGTDLETPAPAADPEQAAEDKPPTEDPAKPDAELAKVDNDTVKAMKPGEARRRINRLVERVVEMKPHAEMAREIIDACEKHQMSPADYKAWVALGLGLQRGDDEAKTMFAEIAKKAGVIPEPAAPVEPVSPLTAELDAWLEMQVKSLDMSPTVAAELKKRLGTPLPAPAAVKPPPVPAKAAAPSQPQADPQRVAYKAAYDKAIISIDSIMGQFEKQLGPDYKTVEPRIMAALAKRKGTHPDAWPDIVRSIVAAEAARLPKRTPPRQTLGGGNGTSPGAKPVFKSERERVIYQTTGQMPSDE